MFPEQVQDQMYSEDGTTLIFNLAMEDGIDSDQANEALDAIRDKVVAVGLDDIQFEITGPAGISADTFSFFKNAVIVLMLAIIGLFLLFFIVIYLYHYIVYYPIFTH